MNYRDYMYHKRKHLMVSFGIKDTPEKSKEESGDKPDGDSMEKEKEEKECTGR